jgi:hypothetical protein
MNHVAYTLSFLPAGSCPGVQGKGAAFFITGRDE